MYPELKINRESESEVIDSNVTQERPRVFLFTAMSRVHHVCPSQIRQTFSFIVRILPSEMPHTFDSSLRVNVI